MCTWSDFSMVFQVQEVDTPDHQWQSRHRELYHGHGSSCGWPQPAGPGRPEGQKDMWVNMLTAHIRFQTMSPQFLRMRRKPNSWLPLSEWHVEKPCWKLNLCTKNSTLRHTASSVAPSDESECRNQKPAMISPTSVFSQPATQSQTFGVELPVIFHAVHWMKVLLHWAAV